MIKTLINIVLFSFYNVLLLSSSLAYADQEWRIVFLPEPSPSTTTNKKTISPSTQVIKSNEYDPFIEQAIIEQLIAANFEVLDKKLLLAEENIPEEKLANNSLTLSPKLSPESLPELIAEQDANLAIRYQLTISRQTTITSPKWYYQLSLSMVDLISKNKIESHQETFVFTGMPQGCNKHCQRQQLGQWASQLARDAGAILVEKLQHIPRRYHYLLTFNDFTVVELSKIQQFITEQEHVVFSELIKNLSPKQQSIHHVAGRQYHYVSLLPADKLDMLFNKFFYVHDIVVTKKDSEGHTFHFVRKDQPLWIWFFIVFFALLILLLIFTLFIKPTKEQRKLTLLDKKYDLDFKQSKEQLIEKISLLKKNNQSTYQALSALDYFIVKYQPAKKDVLLSEKLTLIRLELLNQITPLKGSIQCNNFYIYQESSIEIGREITKNPNTSLAHQIPSIIFGYQHLMPIGQQAQINVENGHYYWVNKNSTTHSLFNYQQLPVGVSQLIQHQNTITLALNKVDEIVPCQLICNEENGSLLLRLNHSLPGLFDEQQMSTVWPSWQQDVKKRWLLQQDKVAIVLDENGTLLLGGSRLNSTSSTPALAWLNYDNGYTLTPVIQQLEQSISTPVYINNVAIYKQVTISENCQIVIADQTLKIT